MSGGQIIDDCLYTVGPDTPHVVTVSPGEVFSLCSPDASGNQLRPGVAYDAIDPARLFPVAGPVGIAGVGIGDAVGVAVVDVRPSSRGHVWTRPGLGFRNPGWLAVRVFNTETLSTGGANARTVPSRLHLGALGVLPARTAPPRTLGLHGGNLDVPFLGPGAMLWAPAAVPGGGVFCGDVHAAIGDGELCGTGIEVEAEVDLVATKLASWQLLQPVVMTNERCWVVGIGSNVEDAIASVLPVAITAVREALGESEDQAYLIASLMLEIKVCQLVNPLTSVAISLGAGLDRHLAPEAAWLAYQGLVPAPRDEECTK
ncbi:acetamidase/formamidase family protein [Pseudonocardia kujensis]|uniref:acetamidase/formamidase family protein n=1 Tax=Pseudonocardia kujensis TaxID=1128675 RepID=UPI001E5AA9BD|nr:acetamidase/formamidase family protein [Pseudonocardia kujensis]MCE0764971.1 acetamidase/formamidase family protein [Pseudonocardia kujensis]